MLAGLHELLHTLIPIHRITKAYNGYRIS